MNNPPTFQPLGVSRFRALPAELRRRIYYFAVVEPHPLPLMTHLFGDIPYCFGVEKDLRMLETCKEFRTEMSDLLYSENSFTYAIPRFEVEEDTKSFKIDLKRVQKFHLPVGCLTELPDDGDSDIEEVYYPTKETERFLEDLKLFVTTLAFESHKLKYFLIECKIQDDACLANDLSPLFLLRNIGLVHFRSRQIDLHHYFRLLEAFMMSDRPVPFRDMHDLRRNQDWSFDLIVCPEESWLLRRLDRVASVVVKPQEQLEVIAKELYSILGIEADFIPQIAME